MRAVQLTGPGNLELREVGEPGAPGEGDVLVEILSVGICGSDLHMYATGMIGGIELQEPAILGHEFSARILEVGAGAVDEHGNPLLPGMRVAVEPHVACGQCECCLEGNPNLCPHHYFYGVFPTPGALCERMVVKARNCFPLPDDLGNDAGALLEPLGVAIHSIRLAKVQVGDTVSVIGCGPIGLLTGRLALLAGASRVVAFDFHPWRVDLARKWGMEASCVEGDQAVAMVMEATDGRGVDVAIEAAWADHSVQQSAEMAKCGGRLVLVGISPEDQITLRHATARRKGLTIKVARRMKHTYHRAMDLASGEVPRVVLEDLVSHVNSLDQTMEAFTANARYEQGLIKAIIRVC